MLCIDNSVPFSGFFHDPSTGFGSLMRDIDEAYARLPNREAASLAEGPASRIPVATAMTEHPPTRTPTSTKPQVSIRPNCPRKVFPSMGRWALEGIYPGSLLRYWGLCFRMKCVFQWCCYLLNREGQKIVKCVCREKQICPFQGVLLKCFGFLCYQTCTEWSSFFLTFLAIAFVCNADCVKTKSSEWFCWSCIETYG